MYRTLIGIVLLSLIVGVAGKTRAQEDDLVAGNNAFAFDFYQQAAAENTNLIFSPFSVSQAFGMLMAGARGNTAQQMADTLHYPDDLHAAFAVLNANLRERETSEDDVQRLQLHIANSLWAQQDFPFRQDYIDLVGNFYDGGLNLVDFVNAAEAARQTINAWVEDQTEDKIQDILPEGVVGADTRMVLVNAIYFKAGWLFPFQEAATQDGDFTLLDGSTITVPMMLQNETFYYMQGNGFQAVELPYAGGDMAMLIVLPDEGQFAAVQAGLNEEQFRTLRGSLAPQSLQLSMPRFEFETSLDLKSSLEAMGMTDVFDGDLADLSGMFDPAAVDGNLFVSAALHKAYIGVDEAGTEAAAATAIVVGVTSAMPDEPLTLRLDHPFIYTIYDRQSGSILFLGQVMNP